MFTDWENFYLIVGPSAAALIGLMFVVITLTAGHERQQVEYGKHFYTSPIVWHLAVILALSGAAAAPTMTPKLFAVAAGGLAVLGVGLGIRSAVAIARRPGDPDSPGFDMFWYGIAPGIAYVGLAAASLSLLRGWEWATTAIAAALMALLLISIHAEWDLVTYLAPAAGGGKDPD